MPEKPLSNKTSGFMPKKLPKQTTHIVRPVKYMGNISAFLGLLALFAAFLGFLGAISRIFGLGISIPGIIPVSIVAAIMAILGLFTAGRQEKIEVTGATKIGVLTSVIALMLSLIAIVTTLAMPPSASPLIPTLNPDGNQAGTDYCSTNADCNAFASRHCGGDGAICSSDNLCHCIFAFCTGNSCRPVSCSEGCDANSHCDTQSGTCIFNQGGKITE